MATNPVRKTLKSTNLVIFLVLLLGVCALGLWLTRSWVAPLVIAFFGIIIALIGSTRWVNMPDALAMTNFLWVTKYPYDRIRQVYVASIPTDPSVVQAGAKFAKIVGQAVAPGLMAGMTPELMAKMAPQQLWIDMANDDGTVRSIPLAENQTNYESVQVSTRIAETAGSRRMQSRRSRTVKLKQLGACLKELEPRLPAGTIASDIWPFFTDEFADTNDPARRIS